jgi:BirA family biotin operon repressor/biotin-[acetyl-CoA-carboxylase] ligase
MGAAAERLTWHDTVLSTNDLALRAAEHGAAAWTVIGADQQTAGRGRHGRAWASPARSGLYVSVIVRPVSTAPLLTIAAGVALADAVERASGLAVTLKWPNDLLVSGRKLAGILAEGAASFVVIGFGINLLPAAYPPDVAARATSLEGELGRPVDRGIVLRECLSALRERVQAVERGDSGAVIDAWRKRAAPTLQRPVEWKGEGGSVRGVAEDIDADGALLVRTATGRERIISGEVLWT